MSDRLIVRRARQHNLQGIDLDLPRRAITVITGPSGSGKSSLAFDTIYAEGQRRYVESLSAYARQFLERMPKPDVDLIEGLSPAVAIEQSEPSKSSRSTVGTATEIADYLRLLWARAGRTICPLCGRELRPDTPASATDAVLSHPAGARVMIGFVLHASEKITHATLVDALRAKGFVRLLVDGTMLHLDELPPKLDLARATERVVIVDRLSVDPATRTRFDDAFHLAFTEGEGDAVALFPDTDTRLRFTTRFECPNDGHRAPVPSPQLFSFNNPQGACSTCNGFGATLEYDESLIVPYPERTLAGGAVHPWTMPRYENKRRALAEHCRAQGIPLDVPWQRLSAAQRALILRGKAKGFTGIVTHLVSLEEKKYKQYIRVFLRQYQLAVECHSCGGSRLTAAARDVRVGGERITTVTAWPVDQLRDWIDALALTPNEMAIATHVLHEARARLRFLCDVGLTYLTLDRPTRTLSGGEAQRITLANALGAQLVDTLYVLDEPSIGLHPRDLDRLIDIVRRLRDGGNTVLIVEHDLEAIRAADWMVELGPGSGSNGGHVVFSGPRDRFHESPLTGGFLSGARNIVVPAERRAPTQWITLTGAREHNLRGVDIRVPLGALTCVTGVSGSGKSTLVHDVLYRALETRLTGEHSARQHLGERVGAFDTLTGAESIQRVVLVDQEPIGRTPRSNPVTYVKAYDEIRKLFADTPLARQRRLTPGHFSFNVAGGRCETCEGAGAIGVEMVFMADVFVPCDSCGGQRFKPTVLEVTFRGKNIIDVLEMTVDEAIRFFHHEEKLGQALWEIQQVGLGYLRLGQSATTLSGGEAQRLKIARELVLGAKGLGRGLYVMDEPTTGLHLEDIRALAQVFDRLVDQGHTVLLIEHNVDVIKLADWVIDLGPEGGAGGGTLVAMGTPETVAAVEDSHTGRWLRPVLGPVGAAKSRPARARARSGAHG
ncbi:MAG: excinuclease ABC subunit UvrA [Gemmatimonadaceae bacterium]|nr:excinuclease ABC subunit UvrA [Gemmatimonadaceae bacterium]